MYAGSILGWLDYLEDRISDVLETSPVSTSPIAEARTTAVQEALLEATPVFRSLSTIVDEGVRPTDAGARSTSAVLRTFQSGSQPTIDELSHEVRDHVRSSPDFVVCNRHVLIILAPPTSTSTLVPVLEHVLDKLQLGLQKVRDVIKFLNADQTAVSESLLQRWKQIGGLLNDFSALCGRLLEQTKDITQVKTEVNIHIESTESIGEDLVEESYD